MKFNEFYKNFIITKNEKEIRKKSIIEKFYYTISDEEFNDFYYSLYRFANNKPFNYFEKKAVKNLLKCFLKNDLEFIKGLKRFNNEITSAVFSMLRKSNSWLKDDKVELNKISNIIEFENLWHPEYIRYCEHIYNHLIKILLHIIEKNEGKDYPAR